MCKRGKKESIFYWINEKDGVWGLKGGSGQECSLQNKSLKVVQVRKKVKVK